MVGGIVAGENIAGHWRYLGAAAASPHPGPDPPRGRWHPAALATVQTFSWAPGLSKLTARAGAIAALRGSFGIRAAEWNMYAAPLVTYPAHISPPPTAARALLDRLGATAFKTRGWAPWPAASALGIVRGAPRDLFAAIRAGALRAFLLGTSWGPPTAPHGPPAWLRALRQAALAGPALDTPPGWPLPAQWWETLRLAAGEAAGFAAAARALTPKQLYQAAWELLYLQPLQRWCRHRSVSRRWLPTGGCTCIAYRTQRGPLQRKHAHGRA